MDARWIRWPASAARRTAQHSGNGPIGFGGDYNPEQWPEEVWQDDVRLMREAGVNLVTVGVFAWARLQPAPDQWDFGWLDRVLDLLHDHDIAVDLGTATASPPPWLTAAHPEMLPVDRHGHVLHQGGRQSWSPSSPAYREHSLRLVHRIAERYAEHPALSLWHVSNELGCHNARCYSEASSVAFRRWLRERYGDLETLNAAWATDFWSQRYGTWDEVQPPRLAPAFSNPTQQLDYARFSSDALRDQLRAEVAVLREHTPEVPVTTNFMVMWTSRELDYASWAGDVDLLSNDHYARADDPHPEVELAFSADHVRGLAGGRPWMLMESAVSAVSWQPVNTATPLAEMRRRSLTQVARGADAVCFFQWRASRAGAEKYHSALVPHAGTETAQWRAVVGLGADLAALAEVTGSTVPTRVALLMDYECWWAAELDAHPSSRLRYRECAVGWYDALWADNIGVDVVPPHSSLDGYDVVVAPMLYLVRDEHVAALTAAVERGAHVVLTYFSGIVDEHDHVRLGGYPGAFRDLLGIQVEEFRPLLDGAEIRLDGPLLGGGTGSLWTEPVTATAAKTVASYADGPSAGFAAVTRHDHGAGAAWYVSTELDPGARRILMRTVCADAGVAAPVAATEGVEVSVRTRGAVNYVFALNHTDVEGTVAAAGTDLLTGQVYGEETPVPPGGAVVLRTSTSM